MTNERSQGSAHGLNHNHVKERILLAALSHVPFTGWTQASLAAAIRDVGMEEGSEALNFPDGPRDLIEYFSAYTDEKMLTVLAAENLEAMKLRDRIATGVRVRLDLLARHREAVRRALAFLSLPGNTPLGVKSLFNTVDAIWRAAGDESTDFSYYTKRMILAGVYSATLLYWLDDESEGFQDTFAFLERRLGEVMEMSKGRARVEKMLENFPNPFRLWAEFAGRGRDSEPPQPSPPGSPPPA